MMIKSTLVAAMLATLLTGSALADDRSNRNDDGRYYGQSRYSRYDDGRHDDWRHDGRRQGNWRHIPPAHYRSNQGYRLGYETGWRDASWNCRYDYRPGRWYRDSRDDYWYFGFQVTD
jgi:opacity protein-like surface antigen